MAEKSREDMSILELVNRVCKDLEHLTIERYGFLLGERLDLIAALKHAEYAKKSFDDCINAEKGVK